jgi:polysaccharide export outer membrane protein
VIGVDDLLTVSFWRDSEHSADVVVRPDGKISLPLLNDIEAAGLTPEELAKVAEKAASKFITDPVATVIIREVRSRKVYVVGEVVKPGVVTLNDEMNVLQALASVGGPLEFADKEDITIVRKENGQERRFRFNYNEVLRGRRMQQNIVLQPGDTILVH